MAHAGLAGWLEVEHVALTPEEAALFAEATERNPPLVADDPPPGYTFTARGAAEPAEHEERLTAWAARLPVVRRVQRAWRVPGEGAPQPAAWVHLVVVDAGTPPHHAVFPEPGVHTIAEQEELPPYLAAAEPAELRHGHRTAPEFRARRCCTICLSPTGSRRKTLISGLQRGGVPFDVAAYCVQTLDGVVITWDGDVPTTGWYAGMEAVDRLHGQAGAAVARTDRHRVIRLDAPGRQPHHRLGHARLLLRRRLPVLHRSAEEGLAALDAGTGTLIALDRADDVTGLSGTGRVAVGLELPSGAVVLTWRSDLATLTTYHRLRDVDLLHGHDGRTRTVPVTDRVDAIAAADLLRERLAPVTATTVTGAAQLGLDLPDLLATAEQQAAELAADVRSLPAFAEQFGPGVLRDVAAVEQALAEAQAALPRLPRDRR